MKPPEHDATPCKEVAQSVTRSGKESGAQQEVKCNISHGPCYTSFYYTIVIPF
jgi:hypothetical protein